ncbi:unnamed protein product, partial [Prorocentrum cordatum]
GTSHSFGRLGLGALSPATAARTRSSECVEEVARLGTPDGAPGSPRSSSSPPREDMASPISPSSRNAWLAGMQHKMPRLISSASNSGSSENIKETGCTAQQPDDTDGFAAVILGGAARSDLEVRLSFDLVLTTDADCINQLFNVLFNTMRHVYCEMHEHGIIGDVALAWLTEAVGEAMDCAGHEVNARTATDFR